MSRPRLTGFARGANPARDGDPCCPYPDTWGQVALGGLAVAALAVVALGLALLAAALAGVAVRGEVPGAMRRRREHLRSLAIAWLVRLAALTVAWALTRRTP